METPAKPPDFRRVLILACSATKLPDAGDLPAYLRYDGPTWRTTRAAIASIPPRYWPDGYALSAEYGLIPCAAPIPHYERRLDATRARELGDDPDQARAMAAAIADADALLIAGGQAYRDLAADLLYRVYGPRPKRGAPRFPAPVRWKARRFLIREQPFETCRGIGEQLAVLKEWITAPALADVDRRLFAGAEAAAA